MTDNGKAQNLMHRITNCLQTILDLEPDLKRLELGHVLLKEFGILKAFLLKIDKFDLDETDVQRIENATASFLEELRTPLEERDRESSQPRLIQ